MFAHNENSLVTLFQLLLRCRNSGIESAPILPFFNGFFIQIIWNSNIKKIIKKQPAGPNKRYGKRRHDASAIFLIAVFCSSFNLSALEQLEIIFTENIFKLYKILL